MYVYLWLYKDKYEYKYALMYMIRKVDLLGLNNKVLVVFIDWQCLYGISYINRTETVL